jgi:hypothetical protein
VKTSVRFLFAMLGTAWILLCVILWVIYGQSFQGAAAVFWYALGWILAGGVAAAPFIIYDATGGQRVNTDD